MKITVEFLVPDDYDEELYEVLSEFAGLELDLPYDLVPQAGDYINFRETDFVNPPEFWDENGEEEDFQRYKVAYQAIAERNLKVVRRVFSRDRITLFFEIDSVALSEDEPM
ncbi:hypothetical protein [Siphonobacter aquaeclarae]|jgi:hypothetical protein|uniref:Uncharacterized protein n=1 Tax=Siphonobacter aquaeclarae TaxID=563176 RepID=A0A1G9HLB0_9BACT|nr:hypothetical protein [Siphonobacter aquaeclarae]MBO9640748.1 hypothetical protein [Siphonobacter aquaeclarae]SDL13566.1 hypothetical protein SAMN04488090_0101 [Siphonobacter aquaeclarae]